MPSITVGSTQRLENAPNPYVPSLAAALTDFGVVTVSIRLTAVQVVRRRVLSELDVVHVHWPEHLGFVKSGGVLRGIYNSLRLAQLLGGLATCTLLRVPVVWTIHNLKPHDATASFGARVAYRLISRRASRAFAHSNAAARQAASRFPRLDGRIVVTPHGNYDSAYPPSRRSPSEVRGQRSIPLEADLLLAFGRLMPYKQLEEMIDHLAVQGNGLHLLIAGEPTDLDYAARLRSAADGAENIHLLLEHLPDDGVADIFEACDLAVLNYGELFSSGALLLALTQGVSVVARKSGAISEVASWPAVTMYDDVSDLSSAAGRLLSVPSATRREAALEAASEASWNNTAQVTADGYRAAIRGLG